MIHSDPAHTIGTQNSGARCSIAVVCCYYNPCGYQSKLNNFLKFYHKLSKQIDRIQIVELSYNHLESLPLPDNLNSLKVSSDSVLWHKENLLNIGIDALIKEGYNYIAWVDSDVIFENSFWVKDTVECLKRNNLCQIFSICEKPHQTHSTFHPSCVRSWLETGSILPSSQPYHTGYAWAAKSSVLSQCKLYDKAITGGCDSLIWLGCFSNQYNFSEILSQHPIDSLDTTEYILDYIKWSQSWSKLINNKISHIYCNIKTLYHGEASNKQYISRYKILEKYSYNPLKDLTYNKNGVLESNNKALHRDIFNYFKDRKEDNISFLSKLKLKIKKLESKMQDYNLERDLSDKL